MKRLFTSILVILLLFVSNKLSAQDVVTHVVQKGETVASIAKSYGVTPAEIITLNPKVERFLFVGMEIKIPSKVETDAPITNNSNETIANESDNASERATEKVTTSRNDVVKDENHSTDLNAQSATEGHLSVGYDFSFEDKPDDATVWGVSFLYSVDQYLTDMFYCGLGFGLAVAGATSKWEDYKFKTTAYTLQVPLYAGISPIDGLQIYTGPSFNWLVGGGMKQFDGNKEVSNTKYSDMEDLKRFSPTWKVSARLFRCLYLGVNIGLKKDSNTSMTIGISF